MRQVFISYSSMEAKQANEIVDALEKQGVGCWIAPRDIPIGSDYIDQIPEGIEDCPCFLVLLSPRSQSSQWVKKELSQAVQEEKTIFPLLLEDFVVSKGFKFLLHNTQIRPYYEDQDAVIKELMTRIPVENPQPKPTQPKPAVLSAKECYQKGEKAYVAKNYEEAVKWFRIASDQGYAAAQTYLGYCYDIGLGVPQSYETAVKLYQKAAEQGYARAQNNLGYCYGTGQGVVQDKKTAFQWYQKAAEQGDAMAQTNLGYCYEAGNGVPRSYEIAVKWYQKAAKQGLARAQNNLGYCYEKGLGVPQSYATAVELYQKAAEQGNTIAQYNLGLCYEYGKGVEQDMTEAKKWYQKAAEQGHENARKMLEKL